MHTVTVQINNNHAMKTLRSLEDKHFISIIDNSDMDTPALPGMPLSINEFKNWIKNAGQSPTIPLKEAKEKWASKRQQLTSHISSLSS